jgi:hypothetical protein
MLNRINLATGTVAGMTSFVNYADPTETLGFVTSSGPMLTSSGLTVQRIEAILDLLYVQYPVLSGRNASQDALAAWNIDEQILSMMPPQPTTLEEYIAIIEAGKTCTVSPYNDTCGIALNLTLYLEGLMSKGPTGQYDLVNIDNGHDYAWNKPCTDSNNGATYLTHGFDCNTMKFDPLEYCSTFVDDDFIPNSMCCACGGGNVGDSLRLTVLQPTLVNSYLSVWNNASANAVQAYLLALTAFESNSFLPGTVSTTIYSMTLRSELEEMAENMAESQRENLKVAQILARSGPHRVPIFNIVDKYPDGVVSLKKPVTEETWEQPAGCPAWNATNYYAQQCHKKTEELLPDFYSRMWLAKHWPKAWKQDLASLAEKIYTVMGRLIDSTPWLDSETKVKAKAKWEAIRRNIAYDTDWRQYKNVGLTGVGFTDWKLIQAYQTGKDLEKIGSPINRGLFTTRNYMTINAFYSPLGNNINMLAGLAQAPYFSPELPMMLNVASVRRLPFLSPDLPMMLNVSLLLSWPSSLPNSTA